MEPIPLPSHIHYELLLQLLERQSLFAAAQLSTGHRSPIQDQVQQLIITLRKAMAQQKQIEEACERQRIEIDYRWSLNSPTESRTASPLPPAATFVAPFPEGLKTE